MKVFFKINFSTATNGNNNHSDMIDDEEKRGRQRQERKCQCKIGENEDCRLVFIRLWSFKFAPIRLIRYWWFSVGICKYKRGYKSHDLL